MARWLCEREETKAESMRRSRVKTTKESGVGVVGVGSDEQARGERSEVSRIVEPAPAPVGVADVVIGVPVCPDALTSADARFLATEGAWRAGKLTRGLA